MSNSGQETTPADASHRFESPDGTDRLVEWPKKREIFGVRVSATTYAETVEVLVRSAKSRSAAVVDFMPVSVLVEAAHDPAFRSRINSFDLVCPDGQPVRWCLNHFHNAGLTDTVCGTTTTLRLCERAAKEKIGIYLYGSTPNTLRRLQTTLLSRFPGLKLAGAESPPFAALSATEYKEVASRINNSGAGFVFVGIGSPKQENFVWEQRNSVDAVQLCVGAAFDFIAGTKKRAPVWMQRSGLEWVHRLSTEPTRLGRRYAVGNFRFTKLLVPELFRGVNSGFRKTHS